MRNKLNGFALAGLVLIASVLLPGCASMRVLSSTPPVKAFALDKPVEFRVELVTKVTLPAGEYKPTMEDNDGYYYQAPSKVVARDIISYVSDGGIYVRRGETMPSRWYVLDPQNHMNSGKLPKDFQFKPVE